jgi:phosphate transport system substrate-binding protein
MYVFRTVGICFACFLAAVLALTSSPAFADDVVLTLKSGGLTIGGRLIDFDGQNYTLESDALGRITVSGDKFACLGTSCPSRASGGNAGKGKANDPPPSPPKGTLRLDGSGALGAKFIPALIRDYAASAGATVMETEGDQGDTVYSLVKGGGTLLAITLKRRTAAAGFAALATHDTDIALADRPISDAEIGDLRQAGFSGMANPGHEHIVGLDGIAVLVSPSNKIGTLSGEDISRIFAGEIADWSALGSDAGKVSIYSADDRSGALETFRSLLLRPYKRELAPDARRFATSAGLAKEVAEDPGGIGFASLAEIGAAKPVRIRDSCGMVHTPSEFSVKAGGYALSRMLYFYTATLENREAADFVNFATSLRGAGALKAAGYIDSGVIAAPFDAFRDRIANALTALPEDFNIDLMRQFTHELGRGERLSATLRFETSGASLDAQSIQQLANAVNFLQKRGLNGRRLILAGFSDSMGLFDQNLELSLKRAGAARDALVAASTGEIRPEDVAVRGYGELMPIACNDTEVGRLKNRRVELWLVPVDQQQGSVVLNKHR